MRLAFRSELAEGYRSGAQRARVLTEAWLAAEGYCPGCGEPALRRQANNHPATDFVCTACHEPFELKGGKSKIGGRVPDGAHDAMMRRVPDGTAPNLFVLRYDPIRLAVSDLIAVPRQFLVAETLQRRPALKASARRAGWVGCNILLDAMPADGRIAMVTQGVVAAHGEVAAAWKRTLFLRRAPPSSRGWLVAVLACVERIGREEFTLSDLRAFERELGEMFPGNNHVREKLRQQLQVLRDHGRLAFVDRGRYRVLPPR